jgi:lysozyme family protein
MNPQITQINAEVRTSFFSVSAICAHLRNLRITGSFLRFLALWLFLAVRVFAAPPDQAARWEAARISPRWSIALDRAVARYQRTAPRYTRIEAMRANGVPAPVLFALHLRESDCDFAAHPHEGSPLLHRTRFVPKGRLPGSAPPYTFEQSAEDAYYVCDRLDLKDWQHLAPALQAIESFNGLGYQRPGKPPSPYLWSGTTIYVRGKFVADGRYSPTAVDQQLGCAAVLKRMLERGIPLRFVGN